MINILYYKLTCISTQKNDISTIAMTKTIGIFDDDIIAKVLDAYD